MESRLTLSTLDGIAKCKRIKEYFFELPKESVWREGRFDHAIYLEQQEKGMPSTAASSSVVDGESLIYHALFESCCGHLPWIQDLCNTPVFTFVQLYDYLVIRTMKCKHIALKSTGYKKLKSIQFFYEGYIKKFSVAKDNNFTFFDVHMKAAMKNTLY